MTTIITRAGKGSPLTNNEMDQNLINLNTYKIEAADLAGYAPLADPAFTGNPTAPTPNYGDSDFSIATTNYVQTNMVAKSTQTGSAKIPAGTTAQRDVIPSAGWMRFNTSVNGWEGFNGAAWTNIGGGQMYGTASVKAVFYNSQTIAENLTIATGENGGTFGPVTVNDGFTVTVSNGSVWSIV